MLRTSLHLPQQNVVDHLDSEPGEFLWDLPVDEFRKVVGSRFNEF